MSLPSAVCLVCHVARANRAERALREHVVQREIMVCFRNGKDTGIYHTVMSVLSSWKL